MFFTALQYPLNVHSCPAALGDSPNHAGPKTKTCLLAMLSRICHCQGVRVRVHQDFVSLGLSVHQGALLQISGEPAMLAHLKRQQTLL